MREVARRRESRGSGAEDQDVNAFAISCHGRRLEHRAQRGFDFGIRDGARPEVPGGAQRGRIDVRAEREHRYAAAHEVGNALRDVGFPQLDHGEVVGFLACRFRSTRRENCLQLAAEEQIAAVDEDPLHPASFCVR